VPAATSAIITNGTGGEPNVISICRFQLESKWISADRIPHHTDTPPASSSQNISKNIRRRRHQPQSNQRKRVPEARQRTTVDPERQGRRVVERTNDREKKTLSRVPTKTKKKPNRPKSGRVFYSLDTSAVALPLSTRPPITLTRAPPPSPGLARYVRCRRHCPPPHARFVSVARDALAP
jgi:hypothetical protein